MRGLRKVVSSLNYGYNSSEPFTKGGAMRKTVLCVSVLLAGLLVFGMLANAQSFYAFFYSRAAGQDLEINLLNATATQMNYLINAYDAWGNAVWEETGTLASHDAAFYLVGNVVPEGDSNWGVVTVASQEPLVIGLEYSLKEQFHSMDVVATELAIPEEGMKCCLGSYYTGVSDSMTSLILMNPWGVPASGQIAVYKNDGTMVYETHVDLSPYESNSYNLAQLAGQGSKLWGLVDVTVDQGGVMLACKLFKGGLLQVKNVCAAQLKPAESTAESPEPTGKED